MVVVAPMEGWTPFSSDVLLYGHLQEKETQDPRHTYMVFLKIPSCFP